MAILESWSGGKTIVESRIDVADSIEVLRYYAGFTDKIHGRTVNIGSNYHAYTLKQPVYSCFI